MIAEMYFNGDGVERSEAKALSYARKACDAGEAKACSAIGGIYFDKQDYAQAVSLLSQGCNGGDAYACFFLGILYEEGTGVARDLATARSYFRRACDMGDGDACDKL